MIYLKKGLVSFSLEDQTRKLKQNIIKSLIIFQTFYVKNCLLVKE